jgi:glycosyltransferase involved in cell wall biosynthesis
MKTITLVSLGKRQPGRTELYQMEATDSWVRASLYGDALSSDLLDERFLEGVPIAARRLLHRGLPGAVLQILEAFIVKGKYDAVLSWAEHLGIPFAALLKVTASRTPHIAIFSWISSPLKTSALRVVHSHIDHFILMSSVQREIAINRLLIPPSKITLLKWPVDQKFWRPMNSNTDMICAVGSEMRDYPTLIEAMRNLEIKCHIAAGAQRDVVHQAVKAIGKAGALPPNITVGRMSFSELRALYGRSRFVVIPLHATETDHGSTSILEAMATGKAVICSRTKGQVDIIQEGQTGIFVPQGDSKALREAIRSLWDNPGEAERMGREGRKWVEQYHTLDKWVNDVKRVVEEVIAEKTHAKRAVKTEVRTITLVSLGKRQPSRNELHRIETADLGMRASLYGDVLNADLLDERFLRNVPGIRRLLYKLLPGPVCQVLEALIVKENYAAVISWADRLGLPFALLLKLTGSRVPYVMLSSWISQAKKMWLWKMVHPHIDRLVLWSSVQKDFALNVLHVPPWKVTLLKGRVDQKFWRPMECETDMICSVGSEMRDYATLIEAMRGLNIDCHIAVGSQRDIMPPTIKAIWKAVPLPQNITVGKKSSSELRALYARSRFVVVPLLPTDTDNGITCILEAMAMGKAVICSRTKGQVDIIQEGQTGIFVPQGDSKALREAIRSLWDNPGEAERMGREGRKWVEQYHTLDKWVNDVKRVVKEVIAEKVSDSRRLENPTELSDVS